MSSFKFWYVVAPMLLIVSGALGYAYWPLFEKGIFDKRHAKATFGQRCLNRIKSFFDSPSHFAESVTLVFGAASCLLFTIELHEEVFALSSKFITTFTGDGDIFAAFLINLLVTGVYFVLVYVAYCIGNLIYVRAADREFEAAAAYANTKPYDPMPVQYEKPVAATELSAEERARNAAELQAFITGAYTGEGSNDVQEIKRIFRESLERLDAAEQARKNLH